MNPKQRVMAILNREKVDRIPVDAWWTGEVAQALAEHLGTSDDLEMNRKLGLDRIPWSSPNYTGETRPTEGEGQVATFWGVLMEPVKSGQATYLETLGGPLLGYGTIESLDDYPWWPDAAKFDYDAFEQWLKHYGDEFATMGPWVSFFEVYCGLRGLEQAMMDVLMDPDYVNAVLDRIEDLQTRMLQEILKRETKPDLVFISDDMGTQSSLLISEDTWKQLIRPRMERWCKQIHDGGARVFFHTDGAAEPLIDGLIKTGIDVLNPIQHICPGMERGPLNEKYGDRVIFHGAVENQKVLPLGTPDDVRAEVRECLKTLGKGGGYICGSCHNMQAGTPVENILAMIETVHEEGGKYL